MAAILSAIVPLIIALLPYLEKLVVLLAQRRRDGGVHPPRTRRRLARVMYHCGRLREACEQVQAHGEAMGMYGEDSPDEPVEDEEE